MLQSLTYVSKASDLMSPDKLRQLLIESQESNSLHDITGVLLYIEGKFLNTIEGRFIQVLEGTTDDVKLTFEKIKIDFRHMHVNVLDDTLIKKRYFKNWSMGFKAISLEDFEKTTGYFELDNLEVLKSNPKSFNVPMMYLKSFYNMRQNA